MSNFISQLVLACFFSVHFAKAFEGERFPLIATSGGVEIQKLSTFRTKISYGAIDQNNLGIDLWFPSVWRERPDVFLVRIDKLNSIEDDTGKVVSSKQRLQEILFLQKEIRVSSSFAFKGKEGPVIPILLDIPSRRATSIKSFSGTAMISRAKLVTLAFDEWATSGAKNNDSLGDTKIEVAIQQKDGDLTVALRTSAQHERLVDWDVFVGARSLKFISEGVSSERGTTVYSKTYRGENITKSSLKITLALPVETKTYRFDFQNLELP